MSPHQRLTRHLERKLVRQRKSNPTHAPPANGAPSSADRKLDIATRALGEALRLWRREHDSDERKQVLIKAIDAKDDAMAKAVEEDLEREEREAARVSG